MYRPCGFVATLARARRVLAFVSRKRGTGALDLVRRYADHEPLRGRPNARGQPFRLQHENPLVGLPTLSCDPHADSR